MSSTRSQKCTVRTFFVFWRGLELGATSQVANATHEFEGRSLGSLSHNIRNRLIQTLNYYSFLDCEVHHFGIDALVPILRLLHGSPAQK